MNEDKDLTNKQMYAAILATIIEENGGEMLFEVNDKFVEKPFSLVFRLESDNNTKKRYVNMKLSNQDNMQ